MPAIGFDHGMAIDTDRKPRPQRDDDGRSVQMGARVALGHDGVYQNRWPQPVNDFCLRIDHNRDNALCQRCLDLSRQHTARPHLFHLAVAFEHGLGKRDRAPYGQWVFDFGEDYGKAHALQAQGNTRRQVPGAFDQYAERSADQSS